jgi:hypothetical protein
MEAGTHSIWISEQLQDVGHDVIVANVRELRAISHNDRKSDQIDAEKLARYARLDPEILRPIAHRTVEPQEALTLIRARDLMVRLRTAAVNAVRGLTKSCGHRMPASTTGSFCQARSCRDAAWTPTSTWASTPADRRDDCEDQAVRSTDSTAGHLFGGGLLVLCQRNYRVEILSKHLADYVLTTSAMPAACSKHRISNLQHPVSEIVA